MIGADKEFRSCFLCRKRKIKCNRASPCNNCVRSKSGNCVYETLSPPPSRRSRHGRTLDLNQPEPELYQFPVPTDQSFNTSYDATASSHQSNSPPGVTGSAGPLTPASQSSSREVETLRIKIKQLEEQLSRATRKSVGLSAPSPNYNISTTTSHIAGTFHVQGEVPADGRTPTISRSIMHKTRVFGQSHWMNGVAQVRPRTWIRFNGMKDEGLTAISSGTFLRHLNHSFRARHRKSSLNCRSVSTWERS